MYPVFAIEMSQITLNASVLLVYLDFRITCYVVLSVHEKFKK